MLGNSYNGKKVLVTGHTGFKGSWLCEWLLQLGAEVAGFSNDIPTSPSHFEVLKLKERIRDFRDDIRDKSAVHSTLQAFEPQIVFHLAAQPLVRKSFNEPALTFESNALGTLNVLEAVRLCDSVAATVFITSDKCYRNVEWIWGYRENDRLGGSDPYSASKGCAELIIHSYIQSFFKENKPVASARAGNVIGGGDWAADRILPDAVRAWNDANAVVIRNPEATRPWQHVLEPLSGYLLLAIRLLEKDERTVGEAFNFGPDISTNQTVAVLLDKVSTHWPDKDCKVAIETDSSVRESRRLKLCCDKALHHLNWKAVLSFDETIAMTIGWYRTFYSESTTAAADLTKKQITKYMQIAGDRGLNWAI